MIKLTNPLLHDGRIIPADTCINLDPTFEAVIIKNGNGVSFVASDTVAVVLEAPEPEAPEPEAPVEDSPLGGNTEQTCEVRPSSLEQVQAEFGRGLGRKTL